MAGRGTVSARSALAYVIRPGRTAYRRGFMTLRKISPLDTMFRWHERDHYFSVGRSARECIAACMLAAPNADAARILDFGCGYGRVLRVLGEEFPRASITASDVDREAVDFCERTFGATGVYASTDPREIRFEDKFDLIWVGSVFTHIDETAWEGLLRVLAAALADDGLLIFTTEGPAVADTLREGELDFGLAPDAVQSILRDFAESGFWVWRLRESRAARLSGQREIRRHRRSPRPGAHARSGGGPRSGALHRDRLGQPPGRLRVSSRGEHGLTRRPR